MKPIVATAILLGCASPTFAQVTLSEPFEPIRKCVVEAARKYAVLDASLGDVADAALASCQTGLDAFRPPKQEWAKPEDALQAMDRLQARLRSDGLAAAAEARLAK